MSTTAPLQIEVIKPIHQGFQALSFGLALTTFVTAIVTGLAALYVLKGQSWSSLLNRAKVNPLLFIPVIISIIIGTILSVICWKKSRPLFAKVAQVDQVFRHTWYAPLYKHLKPGEFFFYYGKLNRSIRGGETIEMDKNTMSMVFYPTQYPEGVGPSKPSETWLTIDEAKASKRKVHFFDCATDKMAQKAIRVIGAFGLNAQRLPPQDPTLAACPPPLPKVNHEPESKTSN